MTRTQSLGTAWQTRMRGIAFASALALPVMLSLPLTLLSSVTVFAADVVLENLKIEDKGHTTTIRRVEVLNTNLSKDEVAKLFNATTKSEDAAAILKKMKASKLSIPEIAIADKDFTGSIKDIQANDINEGKVGQLTVAGFSGANTPGTKKSVVTVGPASMEKADLSRILDAAKNNNDFEPTSLNQSIAHLLVKDIDVQVDAGEPGGPSAGVNHFHVATVEGTADPSVLPKERGTFEVRNFLFEPAKGSSEAISLAQFGYDKLDMGLKITGGYDVPSKTLSVEDFTVSGVKMGSLGLKAELTNYEKPASKSPEATQQAMMNSEIKSIQLSFANQGLFEKAVMILSKQQNKTPEALKAEWTAISTAMLPALLGGDPAGATIGNAVSQFIAKPQNIAIGATAKGAPVKIGSLAGAQSPQDVLAKITVTAAANK